MARVQSSESGWLFCSFDQLSIQVNIQLEGGEIIMRMILRCLFNNHYAMVISRTMISLPKTSRPGASYILQNALYLSLTNKNMTKGIIETRGPSFKMPLDSGFAMLSESVEGEPTADELVAIVDEVYENFAVVGMGENDSGVTFAGAGDPLLRLDVLLETVKLVKQRRHGIKFTVMTSGLFDSSIPQQLKNGGVKEVCVNINAENPKQYDTLMQPVNEAPGKGFIKVCGFIVAAVEAGMVVTCAAVECPGVNVSAIRKLSESLGASQFKIRPYFP